MAKHESGTVLWFNDQKGYGFIQRDCGGDIFVHYSAINCIGYQSLNEGQRVKFQVVEADRGLQAQNVTWVA